jgi:hypothetical protein
VWVGYKGVYNDLARRVGIAIAKTSFLFARLLLVCGSLKRVCGYGKGE